MLYISDYLMIVKYQLIRLLTLTEVECELECQNNGICAKDHNHESKCFCPPGWSGETCEQSKMSNL